MCDYTDSMKIYTKEDFEKFIRSSESRCYLITNSGRIECIKYKKIRNDVYPDPTVILLKNDALRGFKAFHRGWTCRGKQYTVGGTFKEDIELPIPCEQGMHFCNDLADVFYYYTYDFNETRIAEIEAVGAVTTFDGEKFCTNELKIIREVYPDEILGSIRQSIYEKLITKLPNCVVCDVMEKLRIQDSHFLKFYGKEYCDKING